MPDTPNTIFESKEQKGQFFEWMRGRPEGFVLNFPSRRRNADNNLVFHRLGCSVLLTKSLPTAQYHKICDDDLGLLSRWAHEHRAFENPPSAHACEICFKGGAPVFEAAMMAANVIPDAVDHTPPDRVLVTILRTIRDTVLAKRIKTLHRGQCQLCTTRIDLPSGGYYAEAHHLKPLGSPHHGPDDAGNIVCLCPNCHAMLDYGVRAITMEDFRIVGGHRIDPTFVAYHNDQVFKGKRA